MFDRPAPRVFFSPFQSVVQLACAISGLCLFWLENRYIKQLLQLFVE